MEDLFMCLIVAQVMDCEQEALSLKQVLDGDSGGKCWVNNIEQQ